MSTLALGFLRIITLLWCWLSCQWAWSVNLTDFVPSAITAAVGPDWIQSQREQNLIISAYEIDKLRVLNQDNNAIWKIGLIYPVMIESLQDKAWLNQLNLELNVYNTSGSLHGDVWQYQLPQFNNYYFHAPFSSTRLMIDAKPEFFDYRQVGFYGILGVGIAWNTLSYNEQIMGSGVAVGSHLVLEENTKSSAAFDLGVGINSPLSSRLKVFAEYLYSYLGNVSASRLQLQNRVSLAAPPAFTLQSQSLLLGLTWTFKEGH